MQIKSGVKVIFKALERKKNLFRARCKIPPKNICILIESNDGMSCSPDLFMLYEALLSLPELSVHSFSWVYEEQHEGAFYQLSEKPRTTLVCKHSHAYYSALARSKYWITNTPLPVTLNPGREQQWTFVDTGLISRKKQSRKGKNLQETFDIWKERRRMEKSAKLSTHIFVPSPLHKERWVERYKMSETAAQKVTCIAPIYDLFINNPEKDNAIIRIKLEKRIPLAPKIALYVPGDGGCSAEELKEKLGDGYYLLVYTASPKADSEGISYVHLKNLFRDDFSLIYDVLICVPERTLLQGMTMQKPMLLLSGEKREIAESTQKRLRKKGIFYQVASPEEALAEIASQLMAKQDARQKDAELSDNYSKEAEEILKGMIDLDCHLTKGQLRKKRISSVRRVMVPLIGGFFRGAGLSVFSNTRKFSTFKDKHKGERCFLIGNGPSLSSRDLTLLKDEYTFACNRIADCFDLTDWRPTYYFMWDNMFVDEVASAHHSLYQIPGFFGHSVFKLGQQYFEDATKIRFRNSEVYKISRNPIRYCYRGATTIMATMIEMAIYMGFSEIYLIGVDATSPISVGKKNHFMDNYIGKNQQSILAVRANQRQDKKMSVEELDAFYTAGYATCYQKLAVYAKDCDRKIYNATRGGNLQEFERVVLEDALAKPKGEAK